MSSGCWALFPEWSPYFSKSCPRPSGLPLALQFWLLFPLNSTGHMSCCFQAAWQVHIKSQNCNKFQQLVLVQLVVRFIVQQIRDKLKELSLGLIAGPSRATARHGKHSREAPPGRKCLIFLNGALWCRPTSNFLSDGGAPKRRGARSNLPHLPLTFFSTGLSHCDTQTIYVLGAVVQHSDGPTPNVIRPRGHIVDAADKVTVEWVQ